MNKKKQKKKITKVVTKSPVVTSKLFYLGGTLVFLLIAMIGLFYHEMWRDEIQAWLVARDSDSFVALFQNMKYEGNPMLWHLFLFVFSGLTSNPLIMQIFHVLIAAGFIFTFLKYSTFSKLIKVLFVVGYFPLYEFSIISRGYGLGVLLIFIAAILYRKRYSHYIPLAIILALLSNTTIYGLIIASGLASVLVLDYLFNQKSRDFIRPSYIVLAASLSIFILGAALSIIQIYPEPDNSFPVVYPETLTDSFRWNFIFKNIFNVLVAVPDLLTDFFWNTNILVSKGSTLISITTLSILALFAVVFFRNKFVFFLYTSIIIVLLSVFYYSGLVYARYTGSVFFTIILCYWIDSYYKKRQYDSTLLKKMIAFGQKIANPLLIAMLITHAIGGIGAFVKDLNVPFSSSKEAATYIKNEQLDQLPIIGCTDVITSPVAGLLETTFYYAEQEKFGSFVIWSDKRKKIELNNVVAGIEKVMASQQKDTVLLIMGNPITTSTMEIMKSGRFNDRLIFILLKYFPPGVIQDERYSIYKVYH